MPTLNPDLIKQNKKRRIRRRQPIPPDEQNPARRSQSDDRIIGSSSQVSDLPVAPETHSPPNRIHELSDSSLAAPIIPANMSHSNDLIVVDMNILNDALLLDDDIAFLNGQSLSDAPAALQLEMPRTSSHNSEGSASITGVALSDIDWNPSIAQEDSPPPGKPAKKPSISTVSSSIAEATSGSNRKLVSSNIRRKKMIIWMLTFALLLNYASFGDIFQRLYTENDEIFSMTIIKPWALPFLIVEFAFTGLGFVTVMMKMKFIHTTTVAQFHRIVMAFNNLQYLLAIILLPLAMYFLCDELFSDMKNDLKIDKATQVEVGHTHNLYGISLSWNITQTERKCCGFKNRHDWHPAYLTHSATNDGKDAEIPNGMKYPWTCCDPNYQNVTSSFDFCTEGSHHFWKQGCRDAEFNAVLEYSICIMSLLFISLVLSVLIRLLVDKLERYLTIFRPREMF